MNRRVFHSRSGTDYHYRYNNRNRLDRLTIGTTVTANYTYDGLERLATRTTQNMTPSGTTHYVYDLAGHLIAESTGTGTTVREYVWLDDMPLAVVADVDTVTPHLYYVHADHLNRPIKMTDGSKNVVWDAVYWPFGEVSSITGSASNNLRFPGQYFLIEAGLQYNWHRHYDSSLGRYTQPDPLDLTALLSDGPSIYGYAIQSPLMNVDPTGQITRRQVEAFMRICMLAWRWLSGSPEIEIPRLPPRVPPIERPAPSIPRTPPGPPGGPEPPVGPKGMPEPPAPKP